MLPGWRGGQLGSGKAAPRTLGAASCQALCAAAPPPSFPSAVPWSQAGGEDGCGPLRPACPPAPRSDPLPGRARLRWREALSGAGDLSKGLPCVCAASTSSPSSCQAPGSSWSSGDRRRRQGQVSDRCRGQKRSSCVNAQGSSTGGHISPAVFAAPCSAVSSESPVRFAERAQHAKAREVKCV